MLNANDYYHNNAFALTGEQRDTIIYYFEDLMSLRKKYYKDYRLTGKEQSLKLYKATFHRIQGAKELLEDMGIHIAYDWVGHREEWFFPTYEDALAEEDWQFAAAD